MSDRIKHRSEIRQVLFIQYALMIEYEKVKWYEQAFAFADAAVTMNGGIDKCDRGLYRAWMADSIGLGQHRFEHGELQKLFNSRFAALKRNGVIPANAHEYDLEAYSG